MKYPRVYKHIKALLSKRYVKILKGKHVGLYKNMFTFLFFLFLIFQGILCILKIRWTNSYFHKYQVNCSIEDIFDTLIILSFFIFILFTYHFNEIYHSRAIEKSWHGWYECYYMCLVLWQRFIVLVIKWPSWSDIVFYSCGKQSWKKRFGPILDLLL